MTDRALRFPGGKRFAFTVFDDCDNATVANTRPFYELLDRLGMRTTKTVWSVGSAEVDPNWAGSSTLEDPEYRDFARELQARGFEIASHGASMMSSVRARTAGALETFAETFRHYPRSHANHGNNRDNMYWSEARFRSRQLQRLYAWLVTRRPHGSQGHLPQSRYFWGDLCRRHIEYVRGFTFPATNLFSVARHVLYRDPATPFVRCWFLASHAPDPVGFDRLLSPANQEALERAGGLCILATHAAAGFVRNGEVVPSTRRLLEAMAARDGWFVPVSTLLDELQRRELAPIIPAWERRRLEISWLLGAAVRGVGG